MTVAAEGGLKIRYTNRGHKGEQCYHAVCLLLQNGELVSAWDGKPLLKAELSEKDKIMIPISFDVESGEHAQMSFIFWDMGTGMVHFSEQLLLFQ